MRRPISVFLWAAMNQPEVCSAVYLCDPDQLLLLRPIERAQELLPPEMPFFLRRPLSRRVQVELLTYDPLVDHANRRSVRRDRQLNPVCSEGCLQLPLQPQNRRLLVLPPALPPRIRLDIHTVGRCRLPIHHHSGDRLAVFVRLRRFHDPQYERVFLPCRPPHLSGAEIVLENHTSGKNNSCVSMISAMAVTATVSANRSHSACWRSTATAADRIPNAVMERYWPSAMTLAPGSTLIEPVTGCPRADFAPVQIGWASALSGRIWISTHSAGAAATAATGRMMGRRNSFRQGAGFGR